MIIYRDCQFRSLIVYNTAILWNGINEVINMEWSNIKGSQLRRIPLTLEVDLTGDVTPIHRWLFFQG